MEQQTIEPRVPSGPENRAELVDDQLGAGDGPETGSLRLPDGSFEHPAQHGLCVDFICLAGIVELEAVTQGGQEDGAQIVQADIVARSGVNWMRAKLKPVTAPSVLTRSVLPIPGVPSSKT
jgi:hypothetical protein